MALNLYVLEIDETKMSNKEIARAVTGEFDEEYKECVDLDEIHCDIVEELEKGLPVSDVAYEHLCTNYDKTNRCIDYTIEIYHPTEHLTMVIQAVEYES